MPRPRDRAAFFDARYRSAAIWSGRLCWSTDSSPTCTRLGPAAFAAQIQQLMPAEFAGPSETLQIGRRVVVFHDFDRSRARNWATSVATAELAGLDGLE
jgi:hypothetical protein